MNVNSTVKALEPNELMAGQGQVAGCPSQAYLEIHTAGQQKSPWKAGWLGC